MAKEAEAKFVHLVNGLNWYHHKYGDVRYCIHCHQPLPKTENAPDFVVAPIVAYIECKNNDSTGRWNWKVDIGPEGNRKGQRKWLSEHKGWLFIELGQGKAPKGKGAWLIPWEYWEKLTEPWLEQHGYASIRFEPVGKPMDGNYRPPATAFLAEKHRLKWESGGWTIPKGHHFWMTIAIQLEDMFTSVRSMV